MELEWQMMLSLFGTFGKYDQLFVQFKFFKQVQNRRILTVSQNLEHLLRLIACHGTLFTITTGYQIFIHKNLGTTLTLQ